MLRSRYLVDVDCWSQSRGQPIKPSTIVAMLRGKLDAVPTEPSPARAGRRK
jgi:2-oxoglutarate ferredoxin oxidoreductase subunit alpha